jgi:hypothetical protein
MPAVTKQNLGVLLGISPAALDYRVRRMQATGELLILRSGLYALASPWRAVQASAAQARRHLDYLSGIVRSPSYASLEYVLEEAGMIPDSPLALTCITPKTSRTYETPLGRFPYRSIRGNPFTGYAALAYHDLEIRIASPAKALFDMLYLRPFIETEQALEAFSANMHDVLLRTAEGTQGRAALKVGQPAQGTPLPRARLFLSLPLPRHTPSFPHRRKPSPLMRCVPTIRKLDLLPETGYSARRAPVSWRALRR